MLQSVSLISQVLGVAVCHQRSLCVCVSGQCEGVWKAVLFSLGGALNIFGPGVLAVVGEKEKMTNSVNVRTRDNKVHGELSVEEVLARLTLLKQSRCRNAEEVF